MNDPKQIIKSLHAHVEKTQIMGHEVFAKARTLWFLDSRFRRIVVFTTTTIVITGLHASPQLEWPVAVFLLVLTLFVVWKWIDPQEGYEPRALSGGLVFSWFHYVVFNSSTTAIGGMWVVVLSVAALLLLARTVNDEGSDKMTQH